MSITLTHKTSGSSASETSFDTTAIAVVSGRDYFLTVQTGNYSAYPTAAVADENDVVWTLVKRSSIIINSTNERSYLYYYHGVCTGSHASAAFTLTLGSASGNYGCLSLYSIEEVSVPVIINQIYEYPNATVSPVEGLLSDWQSSASAGFVVAAALRRVSGAVSLAAKTGWTQLSVLAGASYKFMCLMPASGLYAYMGLGTASIATQDLNPQFTFTGNDASIIAVELIPASQTLTPSLFTNTATFYTFSLLQGTLLLPAIFTNASFFYTATRTSGVATLHPSVLANTQSFPVHSSVIGAAVLHPTVFSETNGFYTFTLSAGGTTLSPLPVVLDTAFYSFTVLPGEVTITQVDIIENQNRFYIHALIIGECVLNLDLLANTEQFYDFTILRHVDYEVDAGDFEFVDIDTDWHYYSQSLNHVDASAGAFSLLADDLGWDHIIEVAFDGGEFTLTGSDSVAVNTYNLIAEGVDFQSEGFPLTLFRGREILAGTKNYLLEGAISYVRNYRLSGAEGSFIDERVPALWGVYITPITADIAGQYALTGKDTDYLYCRMIKLLNGEFVRVNEDATLRTGKGLSLGCGAISLHQYNQQLVWTRSLTAGAVTMTAIGVNSGLIKQSELLCAAKRLVLTPVSVELSKNHQMNASPLAITMDFKVFEGNYSQALATESGGYVTDGQVAILGRIITLVAEKVTLVTIGSRIILADDKRLVADTGDCLITGSDAGGRILGKSVALDTAIYNIDKQPVNLVVGRLLTTNAATLTETAHSLQFIYEPNPKTLAAATGSMTGVGQAASLISNRALKSGTHTLLLTGKRAALCITRVFQADTADYVLNGAISFIPVRKLNAAKATFTVTKNPADLINNHSLVAGSHAYTLVFGLVSRNYTIESGAQLFTYAGSDSILKVSKGIFAKPNRFFMSGQEVTLTKGPDLRKRLVSIPAPFYLGGQSVTMTHGPRKQLTALAGRYRFWSSSQDFVHTEDLRPRLVCGCKNMFLTANDVELVRQMTLAEESGLFGVTGKSCNFTINSDRSVYALPKR